MREVRYSRVVNVSQQSAKGSNLGGPTSTSLANDEKAVNLEWAKKYVELNGGGYQ